MKSSRAGEAEIKKKFQAAGFEVLDVPGEPSTIEVKKHNCSLVLKRDTLGRWFPSGPSYFLVDGLKCELEDRGYQKFWYHDGKRFPVHLADLRALHRFEEEARVILGLRSLYNQSLGTTSARTVYDRVAGRPDE